LALGKLGGALLSLIPYVHVYRVLAVLIVCLLYGGRNLVERIVTLDLQDAIERSQPYELLLSGADEEPYGFILVGLQTKRELPITFGLLAPRRVINDLINLPDVVLLVDFTGRFSHLRFVDRKG
jgi:predicted DNA repair protein MutK